MILDQLAKKYDTDKSSLGHDYAVRYEAILSPYRESFTNILEIGVHKGGSHKMWEEYFPNAVIHGMDVKPECKTCESGRIKITIADQGDTNQLLEVAKLGPFDLIIDDGSHLYEHQILTFKVLFPFLKQGGIFIVEDVLTSYWFNWGYGQIPTCVDYFKGLIDELNLWGYCTTWTIQTNTEPPVNSMGIESIRFSAIDGKVVSIPVTCKTGSGHYGCFLSHIAIWKKAIENNLPVIAVFEDDVSFAIDFNERYFLFINELPVSWDMINLGPYGARPSLPIGQFYSQLMTFTWGTHAYLMKQQSIQKLLDNLGNFFCEEAADHFLYKYSREVLNMSIYCPVKMLCYQTGNDSDIGPTAQCDYMQKWNLDH